EVLTGFLFDPRIPGFSGVPRPAFGSVVSRGGGGDPGMPAYGRLRREQNNETPFSLGTSHRPFVPTNGPGLDNLGRPQSMTLDRLADRRQLLRSLDGLRRDLDARGELASMDCFTRG